MSVSLSIGEGSTRLCFSSLRFFSQHSIVTGLSLDSGCSISFADLLLCVGIIVLLHDLIKPSFSWWTDGLTFGFRIFLYTEKCQNSCFYRGAHT